MDASQLSGEENLPMPTEPVQQEASLPEPPSQEPPPAAVEETPAAVAEEEKTSPDSSAELPTWDAFDQVDLSIIPEAARPYAELVHGLAVKHTAAAQGQVDAAAKGYDDARTALNEWVKGIEASDDPSKKIGEEYLQLKQEYESSKTYLEKAENDYVEQTWGVFTRLHPDIEALPPETREVFSNTIEKNLRLFDGTPLEKLERALEFAMFKTNVQKPSAAAPQNVSSENVDEGRKQALVASGRVPPAVHQPNTDGMSVDDVIKDALHLLKD